uniref:Uncharacterized protein n=1 Tax=Rhizophora mucronata TaxID=61149 RepID=A0A2P2MZE6_RHIMU
MKALIEGKSFQRNQMKNQMPKKQGLHVLEQNQRRKRRQKLESQDRALISKPQMCKAFIREKRHLKGLWTRRGPRHWAYKFANH